MPASSPLLNPAPAWHPGRATSVYLYHGCTQDDYNKIKQGVRVKAGRIDSDFGQGFYLTSIKRQARYWAWERFYRQPFSRRGSSAPVILRFRFQRAQLGNLHSLQFVVGNYDARDYWSLVQHFRRRRQPNHHGASTPNQWYDIVYGPVAAFWRQRVVMPDADQISFHTPAAQRLLETVRKSTADGDFRVENIAVT